MSGARKPKFRVGQVVWDKNEDLGYFKIEYISFQGDNDDPDDDSPNYNPADDPAGEWYYWPPNVSIGYAEKDLRPLTAREIGSSAAGKRRGAK